MKKFNCSILKNMFFALVFCVFISTGIYAQSSNNETRIIGTWSGILQHRGVYGGDDGNITIVFNSNGTGRYNDTSFRWGISTSQVILVFDSTDVFYLPSVYDYFFSPDGTLFLHTQDYQRGDSQEAGFVVYGGTVITLRKRN